MFPAFIMVDTYYIVYNMYTFSFSRAFLFTYTKYKQGKFFTRERILCLKIIWPFLRNTLNEIKKRPDNFFVLFSNLFLLNSTYVLNLAAKQLSSYKTQGIACS